LEGRTRYVLPLARVRDAQFQGRNFQVARRLEPD
jgi:hypothetical protein